MRNKKISLSTKSSFIVMTAACFSVIMLMTFFAFSFSGKGTFSSSVEGWTCAYGNPFTISGKDNPYCCDNNYEVYTLTGTELVKHISVNNVVCGNKAYIPSIKSIYDAMVS